MNQGKRSYQVRADSVIKGGEFSLDKKTKSINPGDTVVVTEDCGEFLSTYSDIKVIEREPKKKDK